MQRQAVLILLVFAFVHSISSAGSESNIPAILEKARTYESRFVESTLEYTEQSSSKTGEGYVPAGKEVGCIFYTKGQLQRIDTRMSVDKSNVAMRSAVSNGERGAVWDRSALDPVGRAVVGPATEVVNAFFPSTDLMPMRYWQLDDEPSSVEEEGGVVTMTWENERIGKIDMQFGADGGDARVTQVTVYSRQRTGYEVWSISSYTYDDESVALRQIDVEIPSHNMRKTMKITKADFVTPLEDSVFELSYADGTEVTDKFTGIKYRTGLGIPEDLIEQEMTGQLESEREAAAETIEQAGDDEVNTEEAPSENSTSSPQDNGSPRVKILVVAMALVGLAIVVAIALLKRLSKA